jgi:hypothetical protein
MCFAGRQANQASGTEGGLDLSLEVENFTSSMVLRNPRYPTCRRKCITSDVRIHWAGLNHGIFSTLLPIRSRSSLSFLKNKCARSDGKLQKPSAG